MFHVIDRVQLAKLRIKNQNLTVVEGKYLIKTSKTSTFFIGK